MLAYVQSYRSQDGYSCSGAGWGMLAAGRSGVNLDLRQATTIRIQRPPAAVKAGVYVRFDRSPGRRKALLRPDRYIYTYANPPRVQLK